MNKMIIFSLLALTMSQAHAQKVFEISDYAWQAQIVVSDDNLQRIDIGVDILKGMSHQQAADIAVFDANGQALPSMLRRKGPTTESGQIDLSFHRFNREQVTGTAGTLTIDQQQMDDNNNQISRLEYQQQLAVTQDRSDYIIELTDQQREQGISEIELEWTHQPATDFLKLTIQGANDLDHWKTLQREKNLFSESGRKAEWVTLTQLPTHYRYIRLIPSSDITEFNLLKAMGSYHRVINAPDLVFNTTTALEEDAKHAGFYHFKQPLQVNAKGMSFVLPAGYFVSGTLYGSHRGFDKKLKLQSNFRQHSMSNIAANKALDISSYRFTDWWFKPDKMLDVPVKLSFSYPAYELYFINNQQGPFTLAWGNYEVDHFNDNLSALLQSQGSNSYSNAAEVDYLEIQQGSGIQRQNKAPVKPWKTWLLWAVLLIAVLVTGRMAFTLYRDMNRQAS